MQRAPDPSVAAASHVPGGLDGAVEHREDALSYADLGCAARRWVGVDLELRAIAETHAVGLRELGVESCPEEVAQVLSLLHQLIVLCAGVLNLLIAQVV